MEHEPPLSPPASSAPKYSTKFTLTGSPLSNLASKERPATPILPALSRKKRKVVLKDDMRPLVENMSRQALISYYENQVSMLNKIISLNAKERQAREAREKQTVGDNRNELEPVEVEYSRQRMNLEYLRNHEKDYVPSTGTIFAKYGLTVVTSAWGTERLRVGPSKEKIFQDHTKMTMVVHSVMFDSFQFDVIGRTVPFLAISTPRKPTVFVRANERNLEGVTRTTTPPPFESFTVTSSINSVLVRDTTPWFHNKKKVNMFTTHDNDPLTIVPLEENDPCDMKLPRYFFSETIDDYLMLSATEKSDYRKNNADYAKCYSLEGCLLYEKIADMIRTECEKIICT